MTRWNDPCVPSGARGFELTFSGVNPVGRAKKPYREQHSAELRAEVGNESLKILAERSFVGRETDEGFANRAVLDQLLAMDTPCLLRRIKHPGRASYVNSSRINGCVFKAILPLIAIEVFCASQAAVTVPRGIKTAATANARARSCGSAIKVRTPIPKRLKSARKNNHFL